MTGNGDDLHGCAGAEVVGVDVGDEGEPPLPAEQIELFVKWIAQGAKDDTPEQFKKTLVVQGPPTYTGPVTITAIAHSPDGTALAVAGYREVLLHKPDGS